MGLDLQEDLVYELFITTAGLKLLQFAVYLDCFWALERVFLLNSHVVLLQFRFDLGNSLTVLRLLVPILEILQNISYSFQLLFHHLQFLLFLSHYKK